MIRKVIQLKDDSQPLLVNPYTINLAFLCVAKTAPLDQYPLNNAEDVVRPIISELQPKLFAIPFALIFATLGIDLDSYGYPDVKLFLDAADQFGVSESHSIVIHTPTIRLEGSTVDMKVLVGFAFRGNTPVVAIAEPSTCMPQLPRSDSACIECGAPVTAEMNKRAVHLSTSRGEYAEFACPDCHDTLHIPLPHIDKTKGINVFCGRCRSTVVHVPPNVWCKTCGTSLAFGWQDRVCRPRR